MAEHEPTEAERSRMMEALRTAEESIVVSLRQSGMQPSRAVALIRRDGADVEVRIVPREDAERIYASNKMIAKLLRTKPSDSLIPVIVLEGSAIATGHIVVGGTKGGAA